MTKWDVHRIGEKVKIKLIKKRMRGKIGNFRIIFTVDTEKDKPPFIDTYAGVEKGLPNLLEVFGGHDINATFFVNGELAKKYPKILIELYDLGHEIGSHGYSHIDLINVHPKEAQRDIRKSKEVLERLLEVDIPSFRSPYLSINNTVLRMIEQCGHQIDSSVLLNNTKNLKHCYTPSYGDMTESGNMKLIELPLSVDPEPDIISVYNKSPLRAEMFKRMIFSTETLRLYGVDRTLKIITSLIAVGIPVGVFLMHPWEFTEVGVTEKNLGKPALSLLDEFICAVESKYDVTTIHDWVNHFGGILKDRG